MEKFFSKIEETMFGKTAERITDVMIVAIAAAFVIYTVIWIIVS